MRASTTFHCHGCHRRPIGSGVVSSLARPAGNVTGFSSLAAELEAKRLELLKEVAPGLSRVAIFTNPTNRYQPLALQSVREGAQVLHASLTLYEVHDTTTLDVAFEKLTADRPHALMVLADPFLVSQRSRIAQVAIENRLPSAYTYREHVEAGGLIAYTPNYPICFGARRFTRTRSSRAASRGSFPSSSRRSSIW
jgi:putative ABC transport system substrate-binding protein